jgi:hypothetical protein
MRKNDGRLAGILGTVIIHLVAAIIFMSFQIRLVQKTDKDIFTVEFEPAEEVVAEEKKIELPTPLVEKILAGDNEMLNIARNLANKTDQKINAADYIDMVKDEMIKNGQLGKDNYIDEAKKQPENGDEKLAYNEKEKTTEKEKPKASQELASNFKGPTRIYYDLKNRTHTYLPLPIYMCEGSGKVALSIEVNQKGIVEDVKVITEQSTTSDDCLVETALTTARSSRFNADINSPEVQKGTITYQFVAQ